MEADFKVGPWWWTDHVCGYGYRGHVWSYDFVADRTHDGKGFRMLTVIDEHSRECLAIHVQRRLKSDDVLAVLTDLFVKHGPPAHIRSEMARSLPPMPCGSDWGTIGVRTLYVELTMGKGYCESFNGKLRDELLNGEIFYTLMHVGWLADRLHAECGEYQL